MLLKEGTKISKKYLTQTEIKYLPKELSNPSTLVIYGDKIAHVIWNEPYFVIVIKNEDVAKSMKDYFNLLWKIAK